MANHYLQRFASLTTFNSYSPDRPQGGGLGHFPIGIVSNVVYNGKTGSSASVDNFAFATQNLSKTIRLNSQTDSVTTSGDLIGFQSKPRTAIAGTQTVYGCQISAQISSGIAITGSIIGGHVDVYVRGTAAGTITGDVRGLQIELTTDDAGVRDITGHVTALRIRKVFSAGTVSGIQSAIRVEKPEVQTGSESYDGLFDLTGTVANCWHDTDTATGDTEAGYFAVYINGNKRYVQCFSDAPSA